MTGHMQLDTDDDLGDVVDTYLFDVGLARSLLFVSVALAIVLLGSGSPAEEHMPGHTIVSALLPVAMLASGLVAVCLFVVAATRSRRRADRFVVHRDGLAWHHDSAVTRIRWSDVRSVTESGADNGSTLGRWLGTDYLCTIDRRNGTAISFDTYVINASSLGREIAERSAIRGAVRAARSLALSGSMIPRQIPRFGHRLVILW